MVRWLIILMSLLVICSCSTMKEKTPIPNRKSGILTPAPKPKENVHPPVGHSKCYRTKPGFYDGVWAPSHRVCEYNNSPVKAVWVEGYWACTSFLKADGVCTNWSWKAAHWSKVTEN